jgi:flagellar basal-body rod protein FlgC
MISALQSASSALSSLSLSMAASAHDVANLQTLDFHGTEASFSDLPGGGVIVRLRPDSTPGVPELGPDGALTGHDLSNTDIAAETVVRVVTSLAYEANLQVMEEARELEEALLDLVNGE